MKFIVFAALSLTLATTHTFAQTNAGEQKSDKNLPFTITQVTSLRLPWRIAFLPDGRMLITEKVGGLLLLTQQGEKTPVANVPDVLWKGQGGMLGVYTLAVLRQRPQHLSDLLRAGRRRLESRARPCAIENRTVTQQASKPPGHLARWGARARWAVRRSHRLLARQQISSSSPLATGSA